MSLFTPLTYGGVPIFGHGGDIEQVPIQARRSRGCRRLPRRPQASAARCAAIGGAALPQRAEDAEDQAVDVGTAAAHGPTCPRAVQSRRPWPAHRGRRRAPPARAPRHPMLEQRLQRWQVLAADPPPGQRFEVLGDVHGGVGDPEQFPHDIQVLGELVHHDAAVLAVGDLGDQRRDPPPVSSRAPGPWPRSRAASGPRARGRCPGF